MNTFPYSNLKFTPCNQTLDAMLQILRNKQRKSKSWSLRNRRTNKRDE